MSRDSRLRKHVLKLNKLNKKQHEFVLAKANRIDKEAQASRESFARKLKSLQDEVSRMSFQMELIELKPTQIK
jgi:DNA replication protein DnaD